MISQMNKFWNNEKRTREIMIKINNVFYFQSNILRRLIFQHDNLIYQLTLIIPSERINM